jgi:hypothetical protein
MSISQNKLWCTIFSSEGHTKYYCKFSDALDLAIQQIEIKIFYDIYEAITNHATRDYPNNQRNILPKWCHICEENNHSPQEFWLNRKNKMNIHLVYHTQMIDQNVDQGKNQIQRRMRTTRNRTWLRPLLLL